MLRPLQDADHKPHLRHPLQLLIQNLRLKSQEPCLTLPRALLPANLTPDMNAVTYLHRLMKGSMRFSEEEVLDDLRPVKQTQGKTLSQKPRNDADTKGTL